MTATPDAPMEHYLLSRLENLPRARVGQSYQRVTHHVAGDLWLARSRRYGDIRRTLLTIPAVPDADRSSLPVPATPHGLNPSPGVPIAPSDGLLRPGR